jgi:hypothetical protein
MGGAEVVEVVDGFVGESEEGRRWRWMEGGAAKVVRMGFDGRQTPWLGRGSRTRSAFLF